MQITDETKLKLKEKAKEQRLRRLAMKQGMRLIKSRSRTQDINNHGGYMIVDLYTNYILLGQRFEFNIDEVEKWLLE